jgi:FkbM family methyltransferase
MKYIRALVRAGLLKLGFIAMRKARAFFLETLTENIHSQLVTKSNSVLHVGGHLAEERHHYSEKHKDVIWIEGITEYADEMRELLCDIPNQEVHSYFLSNISERNVTFYLANNNRSSSSLFNLEEDSGFKGLAMDGEILVDTWRLDEIFDENRIRTNTHLVLDVQGAELKVLQGFGKLLNSISSMKIEVSTYPVYKGGPLYSELSEFLISRGFFPLWQPPVKFHGDVIFIRNS